jgi:uncharacterized protein YacL
VFLPFARARLYKPATTVASLLFYPAVDSRKIPLESPLPAASPQTLPYFTAVMGAYVGGLIATILAMNIFDAAQPALIYLVPFCLLTVMGLAGAKGEFKEVWEYTEEDEEEEGNEKVKGKEEAPKVEGAAATTEAKKDL